MTFLIFNYFKINLNFEIVLFKDNAAQLNFSFILFYGKANLYI